MSRNDRYLVDQEKAKLLAASIFGRKDCERVFDRDFTVAALAFLCSRLLSASRRGRAAAVISEAYRGLRTRRVIRQRVVLMRIARDCKQVYTTRSTTMRAARVLQRAWRAYLRRKAASGRIRGPTKALCQELCVEADVDIWLL